MAAVSQVALQDLRALVGDEHAREAGPEDAIDGVQPRFVAAPGTVEEASELMRLAGKAGLAMSPRGSGTKLGWGNPPSRLDLIVDMRRMNRLLEHASGDLVVITEAGITMEALQEAVSGAGQMLGIDPAEPRGTMGGIIAANASGPRRLRHGTMKDLLIGVTIVLPDGTVAKSGGKVVKNVAGYDLGKLLTGSLGTLGLIVETIFRLHALPDARGLVVVDVDTPDAAGKVVQAFLHSPLVPSALELQWDGESRRLVALFEGVEPGVAAQSERAVELAQSVARPRIVDMESAAGEGAALWSELHRNPWNEGEVGLKISILPTEIPRALGAIEELGRRHEVTVRISGRAGTGILLAGLSGDEGAMQGMIGELRTSLDSGGGKLVVVQAPVSLKQSGDVWGPAGDAFPLMQRIKAQFDPQGIMNPGRLIGGV